ncbi:MAG: hypothetical protein K2N01_06445 [Lachnospiraceae bacterium]|nr:hypothetical protein [Lachnospiraceae bacterium]
MVALTTPSIASSMNAAVNLGVSPTRAALTEMGMLGGSEIAGRYVEAGVYEQTGDPRLASMARSGTSLLVYGGLAYTDARIGMSGIRHWKTPRVNPLELQPPEQTFTEPNALVNQGNPSTYPAMPGSMSREDIEGYLASLRNESPQGLTADGVSSPGILELGNSDVGVEGGSDIRTFREATQTDVDLINSLKAKYNAGKTRNVANARGYINGESINLECISGKFTHDNYYNKGNFEPPLPENYHYEGPIPEYTNHTEQKIVEYLSVKYKDNPNVIGEIEIISERIFCDNCKVLVDMFEKDFPNIKVTRVEVIK